MLGNSYFYNGSLKKIVAVFGTLFNNLHVAKKVSGKMTSISRVPLMYGPRQRFLARLQSPKGDDIDVAIRMPRMSFEINSIGIDTATKLNRLNNTLTPVNEDGTRSRIYQSVPYIIGIQLSIVARHQDDALQIFEQIIPYFNPEYSVTVKDLEGPGTLSDIPITLTGTNIQDDYEGDFESGRRTIIYTLDFTCKVKFSGPPSTPASYIKYVEADFYDTLDAAADPITAVDVSLGDPINDTPTNYTTITTYGFDDEPN